MASTHHVLLIPGFFGFGKLGEIGYFSGVREAIEATFSALGLSVTVTEVPTLPMASIRFRAARETLQSRFPAEQSRLRSQHRQRQIFAA